MPVAVKKLQSSQPGKVYSFIGAKGGVGTTTVALNVATLLASSNESVIAAEFQPFFGTFGQQLNILPTDNLASLVSEKADGITMEQVEKLLVRHKCGCQVLLGPQITEGYLELTPDHADSLVNILGQKADNIILDLPSQPSEAIQTVLKQSDFVCLVLERDAASLRSARVMLDLLHSRGVSGSNIGAIVVNRFPTTSRISVASIQKDLPCRIIGVIPPEPELCEKAAGAGVPLATLQPSSEWDHSLSQLTERLREDQTPALTF